MAHPTPAPSPTPRIVMYARVSTQDQTTDTQFAAIREYIAEQKRRKTLPEDSVLTPLEDIGVSGSVPFQKRPCGAMALDLLKKGDHLICSKLDRAFRSVSDCLTTAEALKKRGVHLHLLNLRVGEDACINNGLGKFFMVVLAATAELEKNLIAERTREQKQTRKAQGLYIGGKLPWFQQKAASGKVEDVAERVRLVDQMRDWRGQDVSLKDIRERINALGHSISVTTVRSLTDAYASTQAKTRGRRKGFKVSQTGQVSRRSKNSKTRPAKSVK